MEAVNTYDIKVCGIKKRLQEILDMAICDDLACKSFDFFMTTLVSLNILALLLQTVKPIYNYAPSFFTHLEAISIVIFTIEYFLRVWSCTVIPEYSHPISGRGKFLFKPLMVIDFFAIMPFYLSLFGVNSHYIWGFFLLRLFRILKLIRYSQSIHLFGRVLYKKREQLLTSLFFLSLLLIFAAFAMYSVENKAQPETFSNVFDALWWAVVTFTTIGYGDVYPKTEAGKIIASLTSVIGIMIFALPTSILTAAFIEDYQESKEDKFCPHCGKNLKE